MPARRGRSRPPPRRPLPRESRSADRLAFARRIVAQPEAPVILRSLNPMGGADEPWELQCRDGWEWQSGGPGKVVVRVATLSTEQALIVQDWLRRIRDPAVWWAVSGELHSPDSAPEVAQALRTSPWLAQVLPVLLEASTEGSPPPPPA